MRKFFWHYRSDEGETWTRFAGEEGWDNEDLATSPSGQIAVTARKGVPAGEVAVTILPAVCVLDSVKQTEVQRNQYYLLLRDLSSDREYFVEPRTTWDTAIELARTLRGLNFDRAVAAVEKIRKLSS